MEYDAERRNRIGCAVAFCLGLLLNGLGVLLMLGRELWQSEKGGFPLESDDLLRYSGWGSIGSLMNVVLIIIALM